MTDFHNNHPELIRACLKGKRKAQFQLYELHKVYLFGICMRYAKNKTEAEDILQEGFYSILKNLKSFKNNSSLKTWMHRIMVNSALMHIRKYHKISFETLETLNLKQYEISGYSFSESDRAESILKILQKLPEAHRTVFSLKAIDGFSFKEISEQLNVNEATLRSHYHRARKQLQEMLQKEFLKDER